MGGALGGLEHPVQIRCPGMFGTKTAQGKGREAEIKFLSIHERDLPILLGVVRNVSADTLRDEQSGRSYYTVEVVVPKSQMALLTKIRGDDTGVHPGVPAQVVVKLRKRTALQYLLEPVTEAMARSLHER